MKGILIFIAIQEIGDFEVAGIYYISHHHFQSIDAKNKSPLNC